MRDALVAFFIVGMIFYFIYIFAAGSRIIKNKNAYLKARGVDHKNAVDSGASTLAFKPETQEVVFVNWRICGRRPIFVGPDGIHRYGKTQFVDYTNTLPYDDVIQFYVESGSDEKHYDTITVILKQAYEDEFTSSCFALNAWAAGIHKGASAKLQNLIKLHLGDGMLKDGSKAEYRQLAADNFPAPYKKASS